MIRPRVERQDRRSLTRHRVGQQAGGRRGFIDAGTPRPALCEYARRPHRDLLISQHDTGEAGPREPKCHAVWGGRSGRNRLGRGCAHAQAEKIEGDMATRTWGCRALMSQALRKITAIRLKNWPDKSSSQQLPPEDRRRVTEIPKDQGRQCHHSSASSRVDVPPQMARYKSARWR